MVRIDVLFRVLYWGPLFSETWLPTSKVQIPPAHGLRAADVSDLPWQSSFTLRGPRVQVPDNHILFWKLTYKAATRNPST